MDALPLPSEAQHLEWPVLPGPAQVQLHLSSKAGKAPLQCVGSLQVQRQMQLGFICGSLPVPTDSDAMTSGTASVSEAAIIPAISLQSERAIAPQYRMLPTQTDLNTPFSSDMEPEQIFPITSAHIPGGVHDLCMTWGNGYHTHPLARKCEALAVSALAGYGDELDVVAPVDILKQIFKIPYSKGRLSVAVHRVGRTLILNTGPDVEEGEKLVRRKKNQAKAMEQSLFLKFAMQSVRAEACDCPTTQNPEQQNSDNISSNRSSSDSGGDYAESSLDQHSHVGWQFMVDPDLDKSRTNGSAKNFNADLGGSSKEGKRSVSWSASHGSRFSTGIDSLKKSRLVGEQQRDPNYVQNDSENHKRQTSEGFLRVLFWQLQEMRMLLGSDLLLFSNENHVAVSLHLWEMERQVTPLMWLDAWLDNVMASVPELAICYHRNGVVQGYELLKTDDIFLLKGLSEDGTAFFHPHVVQQNALSVLRFLQENCKQDPGTYWLFKNAGEDLMQLFDLSVISKNHSSCTNKDEENSDSLSSPRNRGKGSYSLPLGILLYRLAHRLSLSQDLADRCKCADFFKKCLECLDEQENLFVRASAHEHVARLILRCYKELGSTLTPLLLESNDDENPAAKPTGQPVLEHPATTSESFIEDDTLNSQLKATHITENNSKSCDLLSPAISQDLGNQSSERLAEALADHTGEKEGAIENETGMDFALSDCTSNPEVSLETLDREPASKVENTSGMEAGKDFSFTPRAESSSELVQTIVDPVSARLAAVHHVSQAIKALRWQRQLQDVEGKILTSENRILGTTKYVQLVPVCVCGEIDCIEICDIRDCEIGPFMDQKLWQLVFLLGESYLALGQAYKEDGQLNRALKAGELACSVYDSAPQHLKDKGKCIPFDQDTQWLQMPTSLPLNSNKSVPITLRAKHTFQASHSTVLRENNVEDNTRVGFYSNAGKSIEKGLFWGQAWMLVGDIYVEHQRLICEKKSPVNKEASKYDGLTMAQEVVKEVKRLRKKLGQSKRSCSICSLTSCSCQSDRASSGNSASSSISGTMMKYSRKQGKKLNTKLAAISHADLSEEHQVSARSIASSSSIDIHVCKVNSNPEMSDHACKENSTLSHDQSVDNLVHGDLTVKSNSKLGTSTDLSTDHPQEKGGSIEQESKKDIFSFLQGPMSSDTETCLLAAVDCYDAAVLTLKEMWPGSEELQSALRKKGWACNELGRVSLARGNMKAAEAVFDKAISAFKDVKDYTNVVLVHCNIGHGKRAAAEALVLQLDTLKGSGLLEHVSKQILEDAKLQYGEALKYYGMAKEEMKVVSQDLDSATIGLRNEVHTQYAHTYLRLGALLARELTLGNTHLKGSTDSKQSDSFGAEEMKGKKLGSRKFGITANDAIREAIVLYESLGSIRAQEAAFAQFQLACHHRDCCLMAIKVLGKEHAFDKAENTFLQQAKRYLSLAERYWLKALNYYKPSTHPDMFLGILMERSALCMAMAPISHSTLMSELALSHLLEGRQALFSATVASTDEGSCGRESFKPSSRVVTKFSQQLQALLKTMLAAAQNLNKTSPSRNMTMQTRNRRSAESSNRGEIYSSSGRGSDAVKLKEMYRRALKSNEVPDLQLLYHMWMS